MRPGRTGPDARRRDSVAPRAPRRRPRLGRLAVALPLLAIPEVGQLDTGDASLRGLPGLAVVAERTTADAREAGVTEDWLAERVVGAAKQAGLPLLERSDALASPRQPLLVVRLQTVRVPDRRAMAWHLTLAVYQNVATFADRPDTGLAQTWAATASIGVTSDRLLRSSVQGALARQTAELGKAWKRRAAVD